MSVSIITSVLSTSACGQVGGVVLRADQAVLLAAEPQEADLVARRRTRACEICSASSSCHAVPEPSSLMPGPAGHRVEVRAARAPCGAGRRVRVSATTCGIEAVDCSSPLVSSSHRRRLAVLERVVELLADREAREDGRDCEVRSAGAEAARSCGPGLSPSFNRIAPTAPAASSVGELLYERAGAALEQRDRARRRGGEVPRLAAGVLVSAAGLGMTMSLTGTTGALGTAFGRRVRERDVVDGRRCCRRPRCPACTSCSPG